MSFQIERIAWTLAIMNIMIAVMLFIGGFITSNEVPAIHRILANVEIDDFQSDEFQESLFLSDEDGESLGNPSGNSFAVTVLDFLEQIPLIGNVITFFRILYEILYTAAFGIVVAATRIGLPSYIIIILGTFNFVIYAVALYSFIRGFIAARGGGT